MTNERAPLTGRAQWERAFAPDLSLCERLDRLREWFYPRAKMADPKPDNAPFDKAGGPMLYLGSQIVKRMGKSGWPSKIQEGFRSPERQRELYTSGRGVTGASAFQSPHQFYEAVDIVHKSLYWDAPPEYWEALAATVRVVADEYDVELVHGHYWRMVDSAHVELKDWRAVRSRQVARAGFAYVPTESERIQRFDEVLPKLR